jgi:hypothetical protein
MKQDAVIEWVLFILGIALGLFSLVAPIVVYLYGKALSFISWELYLVTLSMSGYLILIQGIRESKSPK